MNYSNRGFTLIELMIVVAVIGIIAAIAYPAYIDYVRKARRADAQAVLLDGQIKQERYRSYNNAYATTASLAAANLGLRDTDYYNFSVSSSATNTYTLTATPTAGTDQVNDCSGQNLTINQSNNKSPAACWQD